MSLKALIATRLDNLFKNTKIELSTQDPMDTHLMEYAIAAQTESYAKKKKEQVKKEITDNMSSRNVARIDELLKKTVDEDKGSSIDLIETANFALTLGTRKPSTRLDETKLRVALLKIMTADKVDKLIADAYDTNAPAQIWKVEKV
jgi:hypothetical protein